MRAFAPVNSSSVGGGGGGGWHDPLAARNAFKLCARVYYCDRDNGPFILLEPEPLVEVVSRDNPHRAER